MPESEALNRMDDIDHMSDPKQFLAYLDQLSALKSMRAFKQHTFALMGVRTGAHVLDVGCGAGDDVRDLAQLVGPHGRAVGVDASAQLVAVARERSSGLNLPGEYAVGSAYQLDFADGSFDAARADRVFMHLAQPERALAEMRRVVKPGGVVLVNDPDWETLIVDASDRAVTRKVLDHALNGMVNARIGRRLWALFHEAGFEQVRVEPDPVVVTDGENGFQTLGFAMHAERAREAGVVTAEEAALWLADLSERGKTGRFFAAGLSFVVWGCKPSV